MTYDELKPIVAGVLFLVLGGATVLSLALDEFLGEVCGDE